MNKSFSIGFTMMMFFTFTHSIFGADIEVKTPKESQIWWGTEQNPKNSKVEPKNDRFIISFPDSALSDGEYEISVTAKFDKDELTKKVKFRVGNAIVVDFIEEFKKPRAPSQTTQNNLQEPGVKPSITPSIVENEALKSVFIDYISKSMVPTKKEMHLDDKKKYSCQVWEILKSNHFDRKITFDGTNSVGDRFIHMEAQDLTSDRVEKFLLTKQASGWRGVTTTKPKYVPLHYKDFHDVGLFPKFSIPKDTDFTNEFEPTFIKSITVRETNSICITANKENNSELFVEFGRRTHFAYLDKNGIEIHDFGNKDEIEFKVNQTLAPEVLPRSATGISSYHNAWGFYSRKDMEPRFISLYQGNGNLPDSYCFQDEAKRKTSTASAFKMTGLGVCSLSVN